ncbi:MAG: hypothetical protein AAF617_18315 [Bacteroidota bacterium]
MKTITLLTIMLVSICATINAQSVKGKLLLNKKSEAGIELTSSSAVQLFKEFKTGKYQLQFMYDGEGLSKNKHEEEVVFFSFATVVKKDGKIIQKMMRQQPIPYFPGDMLLPAEAFDFIGILASSNDTKSSKSRNTGIMSAGRYTVELSVAPLGVRGNIEPVVFDFVVKE